MGMYWILATHVAAAPVAPKAGEKPLGLKPLYPLEALSEQDFPKTDDFLFTFYGPIAKKVYSYYSEVPQIDLNYPYAPLSRIFITHQEGLTCARRVAKFGSEEFRCNIAFHPSLNEGLKRVVPPVGYEVTPIFLYGKLNRMVLKLSDGRVLVDANCPRLSAGDWAQNNFPCAYTTAEDDPDDFFFPGDLYPQGVAVGWGVDSIGESTF